MINSMKVKTHTKAFNKTAKGQTKYQALCKSKRHLQEKAEERTIAAVKMKTRETRLHPKKEDLERVDQTAMTIETTNNTILLIKIQTWIE